MGIMFWDLIITITRIKSIDKWRSLKLRIRHYYFRKWMLHKVIHLFPYIVISCLRNIEGNPDLEILEQARFFARYSKINLDIVLSFKL